MFKWEIGCVGIPDMWWALKRYTRWSKGKPDCQVTWSCDNMLCLCKPHVHAIIAYDMLSTIALKDYASKCYSLT